MVFLSKSKQNNKMAATTETKTLEDYKKELQDEKIEFVTEPTTLSTKINGESGGHKFSLSLIIEELPAGIFGYVNGIGGDDLFQVDPTNAIKEFKRRKQQWFRGENN